jgi:outer membrane usher protein
MDNDISVNDKEIPINLGFDKNRRDISPPYRSGSFVEFKTSKTQAITGKIFIIEKGEKKPAEFWGLSFKAKDRIVEVPVARDGEFYLENIPAGTYSAGIVKDRKHCNFSLPIPESDAAFIDLAIILCEPVMSD